MNLQRQKYPIGQFEQPKEITEEDIREYITDISTFPKRISEEVKDLSQDQLDTSYRIGGWTIRQVVNHCADSHMNGL